MIGVIIAIAIACGIARLFIPGSRLLKKAFFVLSGGSLAALANTLVFDQPMSFSLLLTSLAGALLVVLAEAWMAGRKAAHKAAN